jgi:hypothetical protein
MGAHKPLLEPPSSTPRISYPFFRIGLASLLVACAIYLKTRLVETAGATKSRPDDATKLQRRLKEIDDSEQYALIATADGWYPCLHHGRAVFYLKTGEVWKYGVTSKGQFGRYAAAFLVRNKVSYLIQYKGTYSECLKQEQIKLFNYPYLPENMIRPPALRLPRPPYNAVMR